MRAALRDPEDPPIPGVALQRLRRVDRLVRAVERADAEVDDADLRTRAQAGARAAAAALERVGREPRPRAGGHDLPTGDTGSSSRVNLGAVTIAS